MASVKGGKSVPVSEYGIAMWGPPGSGKTTFLAALSVALTRNAESGWRIHGADEASERRLIQMTHELVSGRSFPRATQGIEEYSWVLSGPNPHPRRKMFRKVPLEAVRVQLDLVDAQGEIAGLKLDYTQRGEFIEGLVRSKGLIYIFDPMRESDDGDAFDHTFGMLVQLARRMDEEEGWNGGRLPHYVAVCITKFDEDPVFRTAEKMGLVVPSDDEHECPRVLDYDARELFLRLCSISGTGNAEMVVNALEQYFHPGRIRYFVTSAIGFYLGHGGKWDPDDPANLLPMEEIDPRSGVRRTRIRGAVHPINVTESVRWLIDQILREGNGGS
jgi:hypothetical protein